MGMNDNRKQATCLCFCCTEGPLQSIPTSYSFLVSQKLSSVSLLLTSSSQYDSQQEKGDENKVNNVNLVIHRYAPFFARRRGMTLRSTLSLQTIKYQLCYIVQMVILWSVSTVLCAETDHKITNSFTQGASYAWR